MADEEVVRAAWERTDLYDNRLCTWGDTMFFVSIFPHNLPLSLTPDEAWAAAAEFTRDRQEEIRQLREEIKELDEWNGTWDEYLSSGYPIRPGTIIGMIRGFRTSARLEAVLTDLKKGMK